MKNTMSRQTTPSQASLIEVAGTRAKGQAKVAQREITEQDTQLVAGLSEEELVTMARTNKGEILQCVTCNAVESRIKNAGDCAAHTK